MLTPFSSPESVYRDQTTARRNSRLAACPSGYLCAAAGQGDGLHTVYYLYHCTQRSLSNFIDAGAVRNNQVGGAVAVLKNSAGSIIRTIPADGVTKSVDWLPVYFLDPC